MPLISELMNEFSDNVNNDSIFSLNIRPYQIDEPDADTTYIRYQSGNGSVYIIKVSVSSNVTTIEYAYDTWANRATASYTAIND